MVSFDTLYANVYVHIIVYAQVLLYKEMEFDASTFVAEYIDVPDGSTSYSGNYAPDKFYWFQVCMYVHVYLHMYVCIYIMHMYLSY